MAELEFIKNIVDVDVDGLHNVNHYTIKAAYNRRNETESGFVYYDYCEKVIDEFDYTWAEITKDGGIGEVNRQIEECYGVEMGRRRA